MTTNPALKRKRGRPRLIGAELDRRGTREYGRDYTDNEQPLPDVSATKRYPGHVAAARREFKRPFVEMADDYARRAADPDNADHFCRWIRLAAERYLRDRQRSCRPGEHRGAFEFNPWWAGDACEFIEGLPHVEGTWDTENIVLHESDVFFIVNVFGFRKHDGTLRFSVVLKAVARKNAKSTISAAIGLYCLTCDEEVGTQVISAATTGSQARIIFNMANRMVAKVPSKIRTANQWVAYANAITCGHGYGNFKPINAKASTQDGLNPSCTLLDEIHAHKNHDLVNVLRSAAGARRNSMFLYTTTEGYESPGPWPELRQFAKQVLEGIVSEADADHFFVVYYALDDEQGKKGEPNYIPADDEFEELKWIKANPLIDVNPILLEKIREEAAEAKRLPGRLAEFRIKRLNRPASSAGAWINLLQWKSCASPKLDLDKPGWGAHRCWGGLDLASTRDIAAFRLVWHVDGLWYTHGWRFVPGQQVFARTDRGLVPYKGWRDAGYLIECGDEVIDYEKVENVIVACKNKFNLQSVGYDGWNAAQIADKLSKAGVPMELFIQGPKSYHPAMKELERVYAEQKLRHEDDPVLNWCASNLIARTDVNMNMAPERKNAPDKIDDMVALLMAMGQAIKTVEVKKAEFFFV